MANVPNLSVKQERRLLARAKDGDVGARNQLVESLMGLVLKIAYKNNHLGLSVDDRVSEGALAVIKSIDAIDLSRKVRLTTYSYSAIERAMWRADKLSKRQPLVSLDEPVGEHSEPLGILIEDRQSNVDYKNVEDGMVVAGMLSKLDSDQRNIVELYFGLGNKDQHNYREIGAILGISTQAAQMKVVKALKVIDPTFTAIHERSYSEREKPDFKVCKFCEIEKPIKDFPVVHYNTGRTGTRNICKVCKSNEKRLKRLRKAEKDYDISSV